MSHRCCQCLCTDLGRLASGWPAGGGWRPCAASLAACRLAFISISWLHGRHSAQPQILTRLDTAIDSMQGRFSCAARIVHAWRSTQANMRGAHSTPAASFHSLQVPGLEARQLLGLAGQRLIVEEARLLRVAAMAQVSALAVCTGMKYGEDGACNSAHASLQNTGPSHKVPRSGPLHMCAQS